MFLASEPYGAGKTKNKELNYRHFTPEQKLSFGKARQKEWADIDTESAVEYFSVAASRKI